MLSITFIYYIIMDMKDLIIDKKSPVPLYFQLKKQLLEQIESGKYQPGDKLPTEVELCEQLDISRPTVRQAFSELINEGYITRQKAKGTFVSKPKVEGNFFMRLSSYNEEMQSLGHIPSTKVLYKEKVETPAKCQTLWNSAESLHLKRLRYADDLEMVVVNTYCPIDVFENLDAFDFENTSLYEVMKKEYGIYIDYVDRVVEAKIADKEIAKLLKLEKPEIVLYVETKAYTKDDVCVEYSRAYYRADRNKFKMRLIR